MRSCDANWSAATAVRAFFKSARVVVKTDRAKTLAKLVQCWRKKPICTSVAIVCWQRYLCKLAFVHTAGLSDETADPLGFILRWMPLKADRVLPGDLINTLKKVGWTPLSKIPYVAPDAPMASVQAAGVALQRVRAAIMRHGRQRSLCGDSHACSPRKCQ